MRRYIQLKDIRMVKIYGCIWVSFCQMRSIHPRKKELGNFVDNWCMDNKKVLSIRFKFHNWFQFHEVDAYSHLINGTSVHFHPWARLLQPISFFLWFDDLPTVFAVDFLCRFDLRSFSPCLSDWVQLSPVDGVMNCYQFQLLIIFISSRRYGSLIPKSFHSGLLIFLLIFFNFVMNALNWFLTHWWFWFFRFLCLRGL